MPAMQLEQDQLDKAVMQLSTLRVLQLLLTFAGVTAVSG